MEPNQIHKSMKSRKREENSVIEQVKHLPVRLLMNWTFQLDKILLNDSMNFPVLSRDQLDRVHMFETKKMNN